MLNTVALIGRMTRDPELTEVGDSIPLVKFSIAVDRAFGKDETDFFDCICWRGLAETVERYCHKGKQVAVSGRLQQDRWKQDGQNRSKIIINADQVIFLGDKPQDEFEDDVEVPF